MKAAVLRNTSTGSSTQFAMNIAPTMPPPAPPVSRNIEWEPLLAGITSGKTVIEVSANRNIFQQGEAANSVFYLRKGSVKLAVSSEEGKEAIFAILHSGDFLGEGCLAGQKTRTATATALTDCTAIRIERPVMAGLLHKDHQVAELLVNNLLLRSLRYEEDLVDQLFNTSERRLARSLLLLAHFGQDHQSEPIPKVNQETLAQMVGTTRSRVSHFMNKFRQNGLIDYNSRGELRVHSKLMRVISGSPSLSALEEVQ